jgi:hypothetical protein
MGGGGGRSPSGTSPPAQAVEVQVALGYMPGDTLSGCCSGVSFSHSTFLCIAAKYSHYWCKTGTVLQDTVDLKMYMKIDSSWP